MLLEACLPFCRFFMQPVHCFVFRCRCPLFLVHDSWPPWGTGESFSSVKGPLKGRSTSRVQYIFPTIHSHARLVSSLFREQPSSVSSTRIIHIWPCEAALARRSERTAPRRFAVSDFFHTAPQAVWFAPPMQRGWDPHRTSIPRRSLAPYVSFLKCPCLAPQFEGQGIAGQKLPVAWAYS